MITTTDIEKIGDRLRLTPYQSYILRTYGDRYDLRKMQKRGDVLYAPYKCQLTNGWRDAVQQFLRGPRADLIGADKILVSGKRGMKIYATGFFRASDDAGHVYYADSTGHILPRNAFDRIMGI